MNIIITGRSIPQHEQDYYVECVRQKYPCLQIETLILHDTGDRIDYKVIPHRQILAKMSGALISDPLHWNSAKRAEYCETIPNSLD